MSNLSKKACFRLSSLLDENSFVEIGKNITARSTEFNLDEKKVPGDGVVTGYGTIDNRLVYVYCQDEETLGGTIGEMHAKKIANVFDMAMKMGAPIIGLLCSNGIRLEESFDALDGLGSIYLKQVIASGVVPVITAVLGQAGGGLSFVSSMSDFTFASTDAKLFVNAPNTLDGVNEEKCDTSNSDFQSKVAGNIDYVGDEDDVLSKIRELVTILPSNNVENISYVECNDDLNRTCSSLSNNVDVYSVINEISDDNYFFETKKEFGTEVVTGFIKLNGVTVGVVGNNDKYLTTSACRKAADFVKFCDAFSISILTLTDVEGFKATKCEEKRLSRAVSYMISTFSSASIPKVNVVIGKAYGSAYVAMNSKSIGADMVFAFEDAIIGMMDSKIASRIMYNGKDSQIINDKASEYENLQSDIKMAARHGYVDTIINPVDTRKYVIGAFEMLFTKSVDPIAKKHMSI